MNISLVFAMIFQIMETSDFFLALWDRCNHEHPIGLILIQLPSGNPRHADTVAFYQMHLFISTPEKIKLAWIMALLSILPKISHLSCGTCTHRVEYCFPQCK